MNNNGLIVFETPSDATSVRFGGSHNNNLVVLSGAILLRKWHCRWQLQLRNGSWTAYWRIGWTASGLKRCRKCLRAFGLDSTTWHVSRVRSNFWGVKVWRPWWSGKLSFKYLFVFETPSDATSVTFGGSHTAKTQTKEWQRQKIKESSWWRENVSSIPSWCLWLQNDEVWILCKGSWDNKVPSCPE